MPSEVIVTVPGTCCCEPVAPCTLLAGPTTCGMARLTNITLGGTSVADFSVPVAYGNSAGSPQIPGAATAVVWIGDPPFTGAAVDLAYGFIISAFCLPDGTLYPLQGGGVGTASSSVPIMGICHVLVQPNPSGNDEFTPVAITGSSISANLTATVGAFTDDVGSTTTATLSCTVEMLPTSCAPDSCACSSQSIGPVIVTGTYNTLVGLTSVKEPFATAVPECVVLALSFPSCIAPYFGDNGLAPVYWNSDLGDWVPSTSDGYNGMYWIGLGTNLPQSLRPSGNMGQSGFGYNSGIVVSKDKLLCDGTYTNHMYAWPGGGATPVDLGTLSETGVCTGTVTSTLSGGPCSGQTVTITGPGIGGGGIVPLASYCYTLQYITLTTSGGSPTQTSAVNSVPDSPIYLAQVGGSTIWTGTGSITFDPPFDNGHGVTTVYDVDVSFDTSDADLQVLVSDPAGGNVQVSAITPSTSGPPVWIYTGSSFVSFGLFAGSTITVPDGYITQC